MPNDYYERQSQMDPGGLADGLAIEQEFDSISRAFGKLPKPHRDGGGFEGPTKVGDPEKDDDAVNKRTLDEAVDGLKGAGGDAVLDVRWLTTRSPMRTGYAAGDGQTLSRALYPDALAAIQAGLVPVCADAEWLADPGKRGCFTLGDGSTTFRVPDYNGVQVGSYGPVYLGGGNSADGTILRDRIQNLTANGLGSAAARAFINTDVANLSGIFKKTKVANGTVHSDSGDSYERYVIGIDASLGARTGDTTRPITAGGCLAIKLFGAVQNTGAADAAELATAVADLSARMSVAEGKISALEQRKSTCLVNAVGTGAPHETVAAQLPANIIVDSRYVLTNPFGNSTPVICWAELLINGVWADAGWVRDASNAYGTRASYVQDQGVVVQSGKIGVAVESRLGGGGHGFSSGHRTAAPCRVFVRKLEA